MKSTLCCLAAGAAIGLVARHAEAQTFRPVCSITEYGAVPNDGLDDLRVVGNTINGPLFAVWLEDSLITQNHGINPSTKACCEINRRSQRVSLVGNTCTMIQTTVDSRGHARRWRGHLAHILEPMLRAGEIYALPSDLREEDALAYLHGPGHKHGLRHRRPPPRRVPAPTPRLRGCACDVPRALQHPFGVNTACSISLAIPNDASWAVQLR